MRIFKLIFLTKIMKIFQQPLLEARHRRYSVRIRNWNLRQRQKMRQREEIGNPMSLSGTQFSELEIEAGVEISFPISNFLESDEIRPFLVSVCNERRLGSGRKQHSRDSMASWCGSINFQACLSVFVLSKDINLDGELLPSGHGCKSSTLPGDILPAKISSL